MLTRYMEALAPPEHDSVTDDYRAGHSAAVHAAVRLVNDMWRSAVIATDALNRETAIGVYLDDFDLEYDDDDDDDDDGDDGDGDDGDD